MIHLALRQLAESDSSMLSSSRIASVMLVADPGKTSQGDEMIWEGEDDEALPGSGIDKATGIWGFMRLPEGGPLPSAVTDRTITICHNHDIVCATGFRATATPHTSYGASELNALGRWAAQRALGLN